MRISPAALTSGGYLGHGLAREVFLECVAAGRIGSGRDSTPGRSGETLDPEVILAAEFAELDTEHLQPQRLADHLPKELAEFLKKMPPARRREREAAILRRLGWNGLWLVGASAAEISAHAKNRAWAYARAYPADQFPEARHRRGRDESVQRRRLRRKAREARAYVTAAVGAAGGKDVPGRPLFAADYSVSRHRDEVLESHENMKLLWIVKVDEPTVQIPMLDAHRRKMEREAAKKRLLTDVMLKRAETIGARLIWTTLTLPGEYHPNPTNEGEQATPWNPAHGPKEAMREIQHRYHQCAALLREDGVRQWGFWTAQAQQDGTPHRHLNSYVHDREMTEAEALALIDPDTPEAEKERIRKTSEERVLNEARHIAERFREKFPGRYGCKAYVIGDDHPDFRPPKGRSGDEETAASIAKYTARYATRLAMSGDGLVEDAEAAGDNDRPATDLERHAVWASERGARLFNIIGADTPRSPSRVWDCIWKAAEGGEWPIDRRMNLAVDEMMAAQGAIQRLSEARGELEAAQANGGDDEHHIEKLKSLVRTLGNEAATHAYHAALAMGFWPDSDLHATERLWLRDALGIGADIPLPLPPVPLRKERDNAYSETVKETIGIAAPVIDADGNVMPSDDPLKQIRLKDAEWVIVDKEKAQKMIREAEEKEARRNREAVERWERMTEEEREALRKAWRDAEEALEAADGLEIEELTAPFDWTDSNAGSSGGCDALSLIATDPRNGPADPLHGDEGPPG